MSVIRINKSKDYVTMSNYHFKEKNMSLKAKGLLSEMLSLPDDWDYSIEGLAKINKENYSSIKTTLDELKEFGYLVVTKLLPNETESGRIEYVYDIYEVPQTKKQEGKKQAIEILGIEVQGIENPRQYNNINNKIINNKNINNNIYSQVVDYLNKKTNQHYKDTTNKTRSLIQARLNEGFNLDEMEKYLRPETLFGTKFEGYLNQKSKLPSWFGKNIEKEVYDDEYDKLAERFTRGIT